MLMQVLMGKKNALGPEHTSTLDKLYSFGAFYLDQSKLKEVQDMYLRALAGYKKALGPVYNSTFVIQKNIDNLKNCPKFKMQQIISKFFKKNKN